MQHSVKTRCWKFPEGELFPLTTVRLTAFPANTYFWPKIGERDVTLTFAADLSCVLHFLFPVCAELMSEGGFSLAAPEPFDRSS